MSITIVCGRVSLGNGNAQPPQPGAMADASNVRHDTIVVPERMSPAQVRRGRSGRLKFKSATTTWWPVFASPRITACRRRVWQRGGVALQIPGDTARRRSYRYGRLTSAPVRRCCLCCYSASLLNTARSNMASDRRRTILSRNVFRHRAAAMTHQMNHRSGEHVR